MVCGYVVRGPLGGLAWHHLQYVVGLHRMGHEVLFMEDSDDYESCYDPARGEMGTDPAYGLRFTGAAFDRLGVGSRWAYHDAHRRMWLGPAGPDAADWAAGADVLIDVSGVNPVRPWWERIPIRILVDTDPVFTQLRGMESVGHGPDGSHTSFFTFASNAGRPDCALPTDGIDWSPTRQPVVADCWSVSPGPERGPWTTLMQWDSYPEKEHEGVVYGMKSRSFDGYWDLPAARPGVRFALAVGSPSAPRERLAASGWEVMDPLAVSEDPWIYQDFVAASKGELSVAKHGYVVSRSGWFSERSAGYLASGRPVVVQDTGFSDWLPTGRGLIAFSNPEEALAGIDAVSADYPSHCAAARRLAQEYFGHEAVLTGLLEEALG